MANTLVIDTSYGSTVGIVGYEPIVETDSRTHVERLQANIARAVANAGLSPQDLDRIIVGVGPAPFTGLRAGIVTAKALAYATGAELIGQDILLPQHRLMQLHHDSDSNSDSNGGSGNDSNSDNNANNSDNACRTDTDNRTHHIGNTENSNKTICHLTLAVNDARRRQLYFALFADDNDKETTEHGNTAVLSTGNSVAITEHNVNTQPEHHKTGDRSNSRVCTLIDKDIDYPAQIVERVNYVVTQLSSSYPYTHYVVDIAGHGANKYVDAWSSLTNTGMMTERTLLDSGCYGLVEFADLAQQNGGAPIEPLYLRRPDVSVPKPLKHVLHHGGANGAV